MTQFKLFGEETDDQLQDDKFHIGLVMAGAISAGAYTAGVMDFLIEAITAWEKAKEAGDPGVPKHGVQFDVLAGASAGGMCAGIFASALRDYQPGVKSPQPDPNSKNVFYRSWVLEIGYRAMMETGDLEKGKAPKSVLNVEGERGLEGIRDKALDVTAPEGAPWPEWLKDPLPIILSINNLRGVPYALGFRGPGAGATHGMSMHKDFIHFSLSDEGKHKHEDAISLDFRTKGRGDDEWKVFGEATLATGAFPAAFKPRRLARDAGLYGRWRYPVPSVDKKPFDWVSIDPSWPDGIPADYAHWTVDGGTMNNEPMELARKALADKTGRNERKPKKATRVLLMIDPFPNPLDSQENFESHGTLIGSLKRILGAYKGQSRLKIEDLMLFGDSSVASRFAIAPTSAERRDWPLASSSLGAFGGILDVGWRHHDYLLGRLNCQKFLKEWLVVDKNNKIILNGNPPTPGSGHAQIIPLVGGMDNREAAVMGIDDDYIIPWPEKWKKTQAEDFFNAFYKRLKRVIKAQLSVEKKGAGNEGFFKKIWRKVKSFLKYQIKYLYVLIGLCFVKGDLRKGIFKDLRKHDLL